MERSTTGRRAAAGENSDELCRPILAPPADPADLDEDRTQSAERRIAPVRTPLKKSSEKGARSRRTCLDFLLHIGATRLFLDDRVTALRVWRRVPRS